MAYETTTPIDATLSLEADALPKTRTPKASPEANAPRAPAEPADPPRWANPRRARSLGPRVTTTIRIPQELHERMTAKLVQMNLVTNTYLCDLIAADLRDFRPRKR